MDDNPARCVDCDAVFDKRTFTTWISHIRIMRAWPPDRRIPIPPRCDFHFTPWLGSGGKHCQKLRAMADNLDSVDCGCIVIPLAKARGRHGYLNSGRKCSECGHKWDMHTNRLHIPVPCKGAGEIFLLPRELLTLRNNTDGEISMKQVYRELAKEQFKRLGHDFKRLSDQNIGVPKHWPEKPKWPSLRAAKEFDEWAFRAIRQAYHCDKDTAKRLFEWFDADYGLDVMEVSKWIK